MLKTITFVIPVYNESKRIEKTFKALKEVKVPSPLKLEQVIFVNDGSVDNTATLVKNYAKRNPKLNVKLITYAQNMGKGYAIKQGMLASKSDYALFFDADMSTPLSELSKFVPFMKDGINVIVGTRKNGHSTVIEHQPFIREKLGEAFTYLAKFILQVKTTDFTCGFKAFSYKSAQAVFSKSVIDRWGYDAEILFLAFNLKFSVVEKAVTWSNDKDTKVNLLKVIPETLRDLFKIRFQHTIKPVLSTYLGISLSKRVVIRLASVII